MGAVVNLEAVIYAMDLPGEWEALIDPETGEIVTVSEEDRSVLLGMWTFGESRSLVRVEMAREGKIWRVEDAYFGLFGAAMSTVLSESLQYLEALRPIQETLSRQDAREVL